MVVTKQIILLKISTQLQGKLFIHWLILYSRLWHNYRCYSLVNTILKVMAQLQMLFSEWLDQDLVGRIQIKSPTTIFSLASWFWREPLPIVLGSIFPPSN